MQASAWLSYAFDKGDSAFTFLAESGAMLIDYSMRTFPNIIDRNEPCYKDKHYRAHWQPMWAIVGLVLCTTLMLSSGWSAIYDLCAKTKGVTKEDSIVDLATAYLGVR